MGAVDWGFWVPNILLAIQTFYMVLGYYRDRSGTAQGASPVRHRYVVMGILLLLTWVAVGFNYYDRHQGVQVVQGVDHPALPCQMRIGGREYSKIASFLQEKREKGAVRTVRLIVGWEERQPCFYARDLRHAFMQNGWKVEPIEEVDPKGLTGKGFWFHSAPQDHLAEEFFQEVMCELSQERHYMPIGDVASHEWWFFVNDYGGIELPQEEKCPSGKTVTGLH
jgi:hypothetical protein